MSETKKVRIAIIGLNFGACFAELYAAHPDVSHVGLCDTNPKTLERFDPAKFSHHADFAEVLQDRRYDAVHICLPMIMHVDPTLAALRAGKHVACAVPMAHTLEDLERIIAEQKKSGLNYMMMETAVYGADYFLAKDLFREKQLGEIQFLRGCHCQDLEPFNPAWRGFPPMWYMTHALAPLLDLLDTQADETCCFGSGRARPEFTAAYGNPYPIETAIFSLRASTVKAEVTRTLFETAPHGGEAFDIYGSLGTFVTIGRKTPALVKISPLARTGEIRAESFAELAQAPLRLDLLPPELHRFAYNGWHGGSHPHLVHEFIRSLVDARPPYIDAHRAASWCAPGICAHASALKNGEKVKIPAF